MYFYPLPDQEHLGYFSICPVPAYILADSRHFCIFGGMQDGLWWAGWHSHNLLCWRDVRDLKVKFHMSAFGKALGKPDVYSDLPLKDGEGNGNPLHYSCLENPRDGGAWWAAVYGVAQSQNTTGAT